MNGWLYVLEETLPGELPRGSQREQQNRSQGWREERLTEDPVSSLLAMFLSLHGENLGWGKWRLESKELGLSGPGLPGIFPEE